ncbi:hypothetical protein H257_17820 [Aphanomyces astaci]|uniref:DDE Tnp4 domain-containing protein n=1 Tax=Aphanomyces astaci TaxID=112090 RepID=W4FEY8_APHAT|nr:hypothetical protein H257_17820 [Aphanomyces astaci]ETV65454.1 hypothetical protein H257_17820 [Aphanomyces astaci]|eukprot:XP_009845065.1 hypothetical protein H257_17820 [Aphanomyces astaci]
MAVVFGISKTRAYEYYSEVILVLQLCFLAEVVHMPRTQADWDEVRMGFEGHGFPIVYGTLDGSLIAVTRFADFTGWYCRKGFTAFNMQAVVDHRLRFMSYSLRSGSQNDNALFNNSKFGQTCHRMVPRGGWFLGDAGYKLYAHIMTPYPINDDMTNDEVNYNLLDSRTRMAVERAFGRWKNLFRVFKTDLLHHHPNDMARMIEATESVWGLVGTFGDE